MQTGEQGDSKLLAEQGADSPEGCRTSYGYMEAAAKEVTELQATSTANAASTGTAKKDVLKITINCYRCGKFDTTYQGYYCCNTAVR